MLISNSALNQFSLTSVQTENKKHAWMAATTVTHQACVNSETGLLFTTRFLPPDFEAARK